MREMYCSYVCWRVLYSERGDCERKKRVTTGFAVGCIPSFCWIIIKKGPGNFSGGHSPHQVNHVNLCLLYFVSSMFCFFICFILLLRGPVFLIVNFDIPIFEGQIDADAREKWLNLLEGYFSIHNLSEREHITFVLLNDLPRVKHWWENYWEQSSIKEFGIYGVEPTQDFFWMQKRNNITLLETMRTST